MAWDFSTEPAFQKKLDWVEDFCREEVEPLEYVFPYAVRSPDPKVKAYVRGLHRQHGDARGLRHRGAEGAVARPADQPGDVLGLLDDRAAGRVRSEPVP